MSSLGVGKAMRFFARNRRLMARIKSNADQTVKEYGNDRDPSTTLRLRSGLRLTRVTALEQHGRRGGPPRPGELRVFAAWRGAEVRLYCRAVKQKSNKGALLRRHRARERALQRVLRRHPEADPDNVWHALVLLELPPVERLRRGLVRGRKVHLR
jgi:hypothetical protein